MASLTIAFTICLANPGSILGIDVLYVFFFCYVQISLTASIMMCSDLSDRHFGLIEWVDCIRKPIQYFKKTWKLTDEQFEDVYNAIKHKIAHEVANVEV